MDSEKTCIVLVMHGAPPRDFPEQETAEYFGLSARLRRAGDTERAAMERRHAELDARMRAWPRSEKNDAFHAAAHQLGEQLARTIGLPVLVGFNEFCAPSVDEALDRGAEVGRRVAVVTPMMTRGGKHAEMEIPESVHSAQSRHPQVRYVYAWPFETSVIASFLASQITRSLQEMAG